MPRIGTKKPPLHLLSGQAGEAQALRFLKAQGLKLCAQNYRARGGEIDLVMRHGSILVFVEVRYRAKGSLVSPLESVTPSKQRKLVAAAESYLCAHLGANQFQCRFDVVAICGTDEPQWVQSAFDAQ